MICIVFISTCYSRSRVGRLSGGASRIKLQFFPESWRIRRSRERKEEREKKKEKRKRREEE